MCVIKYVCYELPSESPRCPLCVHLMFVSASTNGDHILLYIWTIKINVTKMIEQLAFISNGCGQMIKQLLYLNHGLISKQLARNSVTLLWIIMHPMTKEMLAIHEIFI